MRLIKTVSSSCCGVCMLVYVGAQAMAGSGATIDRARLEKIVGAPVADQQDGKVYKASFPRTDVKVAVDGWGLPPWLGLTSWAVFAAQQGESIVTGELALFADEVNPVMSVAFANGLDASGLESRFFYDQPKLYFLHITGQGPWEKLAEGLRRSLDRVKDIRASQPQPASGFGRPTPGTNSTSGEKLEEILGLKNETREGTVIFTLGRKTRLASGLEAGPEMGARTWAAFAGTDDNAVVEGEFAVREEELRMLLRILRHFDLNITAIHHFFIEEKPRLLFVSFWGRGRSAVLAQALKTALPR